MTFADAGIVRRADLALVGQRRVEEGALLVEKVVDFPTATEERHADHS